MHSTLSTTIKRKKLGILIKDARLFIGKTKKECGQYLGISGGAFNSIENGKRSISLPELEIFANNLSLPVKYFFQEKLQTENDLSNLILNQEDFSISTKNIASEILAAYDESNLTYKEIKEKTGISSTRFKKYINGETPIPIPELETLCSLFEIWLFSLINDSTFSGKKALENLSIAGFKKLDSELQEFVSKPVNTPYLEIAKRLSDLSTEELRGIAEGILEITI